MTIANPTGYEQETPFSDTSSGTASQPLAVQQYLAWLYYQQTPALQTYVQNNFGDQAWMLDNPDLAPIIVAAALYGWSADQFATQLQGSSWWQQNGSNVAAWQEQQESDPAGTQAAITNQAANILNSANSLGVVLSQSQIQSLATQSLEYGWSTDSSMINLQISNLASSGQATFGSGGTAADFQQSVQQQIQNYAVPVSSSLMNQWTQQAVAGKMDLQGVENYLMQQASQMYPWMASGISQGITPAQQLSPYSSVAQSLLGVSNVNWSDPNYQGALLGQNGQPVSVQQFSTNLRTNPTFGYSKTPTAISNAYSQADQIGQALGKVAT